MTLSSKKNACKILKGQKPEIFFFWTKNCNVRAIDERSEGIYVAVKKTQGIQSCVDRFVLQKARKLKRGTWITVKIKNQVRRMDNWFQRMFCHPIEESKEKYEKLEFLLHIASDAQRDWNYEKSGKNPSRKKFDQVLKNEKIS